MKKRLLSMAMASAMVAGMAIGAVGVQAEEAEGYTYGLNETFYSEEPVTYSIMFSDASWYPMTDTWKEEGIFKKIEELTNVTLDITSIDSGDYDSKKALMINAGEASYIIPKTYDESAFVEGGAVVAVSDWVQYMPNYTNFVETYSMQPELKTLEKSDGKYYRLPGMLEAPLQDYTFLLRKDYFEGAGYDVAALEQDWTWDEFAAILADVKTYMVEQGICEADDYIWSDLWAGSEVDGSGGNLLKLVGAAYGVPSGWAVGNGVEYDAENDQFYFASTSEDYKEFVTLMSGLVKDGILDPETFTQDNQTACNKFYRGETALLSVNRSQYTSWLANMDEQLGEGNYDTYLCIIPKTDKHNYMPENIRLENGVMIAQKALDELGEEGFIKMLRFVDWLFYSDEAYDLVKWGVEGETYQVNEDGTKSLLDGYCCGGLGLAGDEDDVDIRLQWGYAGGNYYYGGTVAQMSDNFIPEIMDFVNRMNEYRDVKPLSPAYTANEEENEQLNLWKTPLIDNVNTWTLQFITGVMDVEADWDAYVATCEDLNSVSMVNLINEIYERTKAE